MTNLFWKQGDEVALELRLDDGHHVPHLHGLASGNELVNSQQPGGVRPPGELRYPVRDLGRRVVLVGDTCMTSAMGGGRG